MIFVQKATLRTPHDKLLLIRASCEKKKTDDFCSILDENFESLSTLTI